MNFWIGLSDVKCEGDWRLASNGLKPSYLNWAWGEPNNKWGKEDCAQLSFGSKSSWRDTWFDVNCHSDTQNPSSLWTMHALCEFDPSKESTPTGSPSTEGTRTGNTSTEGASSKPWPNEPLHEFMEI